LLNEPESAQVDVFSFGVLLWELVTREPPQRGNLRGLDVPKDCPAQARSLLGELDTTKNGMMCLKKVNIEFV
jgi:hypothetical protein